MIMSDIAFRVHVHVDGGGGLFEFGATCGAGGNLLGVRVADTVISSQIPLTV